MTLRTIARRYADALFDVARRERTIARAEQGLTAFVRLTREQPELSRIFSTPAVSAAKKRAILDAVLAQVDEPSPEVDRLLRMLADRDRIALLPEILAAFEDRLRQDRHVVQTEVTTAVPLPDGQRAALVEAIRRAAGTDVSITEKVDPAIIGGVIARVGSLVFDGSVSRQLARMKQRLLEAQ